MELIRNKQIIKNKYVFLAIIYLHLFLLLAQRELGMTVLFYTIFISIFYIYEEDYKLLFYNIGAMGIILVLSYFTLAHVRVRLTTWIDPWGQITGKGYQIVQSLFAITAGGFFGTGLGLGNPDYIPVVHTDFIFSAICEEMGLFGGMAVVLLYFILVYRGFKIALTIKDTFKKIVALGITLIYGYQTFIIVGGVIKLIPLTGITLPFISYGGSSLISAFIAFGILQALSGLEGRFS
ncbi:MAG: FtsW/RodA/SpoVE family cell cycle protein [Clostridiales bacterium]|nr:FtsW/RodA/SpoVE family cell cycle protein [Clostridiales bacterium]